MESIAGSSVKQLMPFKPLTLNSNPLFYQPTSSSVRLHVCVHTFVCVKEEDKNTLVRTPEYPDA